MLSNQTNSDYITTQQENDLGLNKIIEDQSNVEIVNNHKKLKERITDLLKGDTEFSRMKQGDKALVIGAASGLFTAMLPLLVVGTILAIPGAIVGLTLYFAVKVAIKAVQSGYKGLKWSSEKTVEGAKHIGEKIKDGAMYAKNSLKEAASSVGQATREGTSSALKTMGNSVQKLGRKMSNSGASVSSLDGIPYSIDNEDQTVVLKTEEKTKNFNSVKEMLVNEILKDKTVNKSALTKEIFSQLKEKILEKAYSINGQQSFKKDQLINELKQQADFVNKLDDKKLQNLLAQNDNNLYEIFSEYHDEFKRIIGECKIEHKLSNSIENLNKVARKYGESKEATKDTNVKYQILGATPAATTEGRTGATRRNSTGNLTNDAFTSELPTISASLTNLNKLKYSLLQNSLSEDVFNHPIAKQSLDSRAPIRSNSDSSLGPDSSYLSTSSKLSDMDDSIASKSSSFIYRSGSDSGFNSPNSSPQHVIFTEKNGKLKTQANLRNTGSLEKLVGPSSEITGDIDLEHQASKINGK
ncbi:hypothetical protein MWH06_01565 [Wolbachia pipientis]|nr:hypothetical protein MWH06_05570 [Wolbachia pipientis]UPA55361.1 hypothetical protein MWH06_01565 [Wolbachia pipientis]